MHEKDEDISELSQTSEDHWNSIKTKQNKL
jgi:hypothetical protein